MTADRDWRGLLFVAPFVLLYALILIFPQKPASKTH